MAFKHKLTRRDFIKLGALAAGSAAMGGLVREVLDAAAKSPATSQETFVPTVCLLCSGGCGMLARVVDGRLVKVEGNPMHPINQQTLCPKGQAAPELLYNPDRLQYPMMREEGSRRGEGKWRKISWNEALSTMVEKLTALRQTGHPEQAVFLYGEVRGQMRALIERFMAALGSPNAISRDSLNIEAAKMAMYLTQGIYDLPVYDLENARYVLSFGASLLEAGRQPLRTSTSFSYLRRGRSTRGKVVVIDPRQGITGTKADEWLPIVPGTDAALALGIANVIIRAGLVDLDFIHNYSFGFEDFDDSNRHHIGFRSFVLENYDPRRVEQITGVPAATISRLAGEFAGNKPSVAVLPGKGGLLNGSIGGLYSAMAIHMLNALVGSIERPGGVLTQRYFPYTEWPELAVDPIAEQGRQAERVDGAGTRFPLARHAYQAVADHILEGYPYPVQLLMLYEANPVYEVPGGERFVEAFEKVPFIVSFSSFLDDTARYADLVLPEPTFLERWQDDILEGTGFPGAGLRQPVVDPLYDTKATGDFLLWVAHYLERVNLSFPWKDFQELVQFRLQSIGTDWETLQELGVWLVPGYHFSRRGSDRWIQEVIGRDRRGAPQDGRFDFFSRELSALLSSRSREELYSLGIAQTGDPVFLPHYQPVNYAGTPEEYPFLLNVVTLMSLGSNSAIANMPTLQEISGMTVGETWNSWLEMNPESADRLGLRDRDTVWVESSSGKKLKVKLRLVAGVRPDVVNLPYNQGHKAVGRWAQGRGVNGLEIMAPATEPLTGLAAFTNTRVKVYRA